MNCKKEIKRFENGKELEDVEFFLNGKSIAYATMQDDQDYYSVDICAVDKNGEKIINGFVCPCCDFIENISAAFPEWEKQYFAREDDSEDYKVFAKCTFCGEEFEAEELKREVDMGYLCPSCIEAIRSRGEKLCIEE
jgi:hypothetical protein